MHIKVVQCYWRQVFFSVLSNSLSSFSLVVTFDMVCVADSAWGGEGRGGEGLSEAPLLQVLRATGVSILGARLLETHYRIQEISKAGDSTTNRSRRSHNRKITRVLYNKLHERLNRFFAARCFNGRIYVKTFLLLILVRYTHLLNTTILHNVST